MAQNDEKEQDIIRNEEQLSEAFASAGADHGFDDVKAGFSAFGTFKVKWVRNGKQAEFRVTDYLREAPRDVVRDIADVIFRKIRGERADYGEKTVAYLTSDAFLDATRGLYLKRLDGFTVEYSGEKHPLGECVERLVAKGLVVDDPKLVIGWLDGKGNGAGRTSTLMHVVGVNASLAADDTDEELLDFAVYALLAGMGAGFPASETEQARARMRAIEGYPGADEMTRRLEEAGIRLFTGSL